LFSSLGADVQGTSPQRKKCLSNTKGERMREYLQFPKDPNRLSFGETAAQNIRGIILAMLAVLVPLVVLAMIIGR
jgi:hypothetical protein